MAESPLSLKSWEGIESPTMTLVTEPKGTRFQQLLQKISRLFTRTVVHTTFDKEGLRQEKEIGKDKFIEWGKIAWKNLGGKSDAFTSDKEWLFCAHVLAHLKDHAASYQNVRLQDIENLVRNRNRMDESMPAQLQRHSIEKLKKEMCEELQVPEDVFQKEWALWWERSSQYFHDSRKGIYFLGPQGEVNAFRLRVLLSDPELQNSRTKRDRVSITLSDLTDEELQVALRGDYFPSPFRGLMNNLPLKRQVPPEISPFAQQVLRDSCERTLETSEGSTPAELQVHCRALAQYFPYADDQDRARIISRLRREFPKLQENRSPAQIDSVVQEFVNGHITPRELLQSEVQSLGLSSEQRYDSGRESPKVSVETRRAGPGEKV